MSEYPDITPGSILAEKVRKEHQDSKRPSSLAPVSGSALVWSRTFPTIPGLYWVRYHGQKCDIVRVDGEPGNLTQMFYGERRLFRKLPKDWAWEWAGPIPEPQEPNNEVSDGD